MSDTPHQRIFHGKKQQERLRLLVELRRQFDPACTKIADKISNCGRGAAVYKDEDGWVVIGTSRCKSRHCPSCMEMRSKRTFARVKYVVDRIDEIRMLTLTKRASDKPLKEQIKELRDAWQKLRRRKQLKNRIKGGIVVIEITHNAKTGKWHPHLHILYDGLFIAHDIIKENWKAVTKDSEIVDIRRISSRMKAVAYVAKYVSKTNAMPKTAIGKTKEWVHAVSGLREFSTFGNLFNQMPKEEKKTRSLEHLFYLNQLAEAARADHNGCLQAYARIIALPKKTDDEETNKVLRNRHAIAIEYANTQFQNWLGAAPPRPPVEPPKVQACLFNSAQNPVGMIA